MKKRISIISFIFSIVFGIAGFLCPPLAIIDSSVLWFIALLLCFTAALLGVDFKSK